MVRDLFNDLANGGAIDKATVRFSPGTPWQKIWTYVARRSWDPRSCHYGIVVEMTMEGMWFRSIRSIRRLIPFSVCGE